MPLEVLGIVVGLGLALVIGSVWLSDLSKPARIADASFVWARFAIDYPDEDPSEIIISRDDKVAFLLLEKRRTGLLHAMGDRFLTRIIDVRSIRQMHCDGTGSLTIRLFDFTLPSEVAQFGSAEEAARISNWLRADNNA